MGSFIQRHKFILTLAAVILCFSFAYGLTVKLDPYVSAKTDNQSSSNMSWSSMTMAAAQYLGQATSPEGDGGNELNVPSRWTNNYPGFAGCFLGYLPVDSSDSRFTVAAIESGNTVSYSYAVLNTLGDLLPNSSTAAASTDPADAWTDSAKTYAGYGYALASSGIDETTIVGQTYDSKRNIVGPIVLVIFLLCVSLPKFFEMILTFLSFANPFQLFLARPGGSGNSVLYDIVSGLNSTVSVGSSGAAYTGTFNASSSPAKAAILDGIKALQDMVTGLYNMLYNMSFAVIIPIMVALAFFSWLVLRKQFSSVFKKLAVRVIFAGIGVPLLLACYTAAIDSVKDFMINNAVSTPISVISATFCDYGTWALGGPSSTGYAAVATSLGLPGDVTLKVDMSNSEKWTYDRNTSTSDRRLVQEINQAGLGISPGTGSLLSTDINDAGADSETLLNEAGSAATSDQTSAVIEMLQRYTKGEYFTASNYASKASKYYLSLNKKAYLEVFQLSNDWKDFDPSRTVAINYETNDGDPNIASIDVDEATAKAFARQRLGTGSVSASGTNVNPFYPIANWIADASHGGMTFQAGLYAGYDYGGGPSSRPGFVQIGVYTPFPPLAIYNLLSTQFTDTAAIVYSTDMTTTNQVQFAHYYVSIAGSGYMELAYVFDACAIMCCLMVLGYGYGFAMLFACFKSLIQMVPKVLTGMLGSLTGIAGAAALTASLIIEIVGTCILYALGSMFVGSIYQLIERPLSAILGTGGLNLPSEASSLIVIASSAAIIIKLTSSLLTYRKAVVKGVSETATGFINSFLSTNVVTPNLESSTTLGGVFSAGVGLAMAASATPAGSSIADRAGTLLDSAADKAAGGNKDTVATGSMTNESLTGEYGEKVSPGTKPNLPPSGRSGSSGSFHGGMGGNIRAVALDDTSPTMHTYDDKAGNYIDKNKDDFEKSIGMPKDAGTYEDNGPDSGNEASMSLAGTATYPDGSKEVYDDEGHLIAAYDKDGNPDPTKKVYKPAESGQDDTDEQGTSGREKNPYASPAAAPEDAVPGGNGDVVDGSRLVLTGDQEVDVSGETKGTPKDAGDVPEGNGKTEDRSTSVTKGTSEADVSGGAADPSRGSQFVMTDAAGNEQLVQIVNAQTGKAYTQADKDAGASYDVIDAQGNSIYPDVEGGMSANTIVMSGGTPTTMLGAGQSADGTYSNSFGGGGVYTLSAPVVTQEQQVSQTVSQSTAFAGNTGAGAMGGYAQAPQQEPGAYGSGTVNNTYTASGTAQGAVVGGVIGGAMAGAGGNTVNNSYNTYAQSGGSAAPAGSASPDVQVVQAGSSSTGSGQTVIREGAGFAGSMGPINVNVAQNQVVDNGGSGGSASNVYVSGAGVSTDGGSRQGDSYYYSEQNVSAPDTPTDVNVTVDSQQPAQESGHGGSSHRDGGGSVTYRTESNVINNNTSNYESKSVQSEKTVNNNGGGSDGHSSLAGRDSKNMRRTRL